MSVPYIEIGSSSHLDNPRARQTPIQRVHKCKRSILLFNLKLYNAPASQARKVCVLLGFNQGCQVVAK